MDWQNIDTVLLDMDGTLLDLHFDTYFWLEHVPMRYAQLHQADAAETRAWLLKRLREERGTLNWYCLDYWSRELKINIAELKHEVRDKISFRPHVQDFLAHLREKQMRTLIVTNAHRDGLNLKMQETGLDKLVDDIIVSHDFQLPKEDPQFWHEMQKVEPFNPATTLLVDDSLPVLESARQFGIGYLLSIYQPDSQQPKREIDDFAAIHHFDEIIRG
ncbi:GMP/IMP nucleotidase [Aliamphritea ceti]|uniref:GMP/IMP nucleotidase n=1 Tax=Aliamphritea ceti TaxID=1524258 RepID=UPI0021C368B9|nr:GMP/IMP nucleotidase [Aliamphritea ceti]